MSGGVGVPIGEVKDPLTLLFFVSRPGSWLVGPPGQGDNKHLYQYEQQTE